MQNNSIVGFAGAVKRGSASARSASLILLACLSLTFSACEDRPTSDLIDQHAEEARQSMDSTISQFPAKHYNPLVVTDKVWTGNTALRRQRGMPFPSRFEGPRGITLVASEPMSLNDIMSAVSNQTGISVHISQLGPATGVVAGGAGAPSAGATMPIAYEGPLSGLLERVGGYFGVSWHFDGSTIAVARFETRTFVIEALPGSQKIEEGMQDDSSSSSSTSSTAGGGQAPQNTITQNEKTSIDFKYWDELAQTLTAMLGGTGTVVAAPSMGTVTVTTSPEVMHTVAEYVAQENARVSRQIAINVEVYVVSLSEGLDFNVAFTAAIKKITGLATGFTTAAAPTSVSGFSGGGSLNVAIIDPKRSGTYTDVLTALSGLGNTSKIAKFPMVTLNNRPVARRIGEQISYVASSTTTITGTSGTPTTSLTPGSIPQGFTVQVTPRVLDDGRILMQYSVNIIDVLSIKQFNSQCGDITSGSSGCDTSGSTTVQSPDYTNRIFVQQSVLKSGSTLIMGGAEEEDLSQNSQGVGSPFNYLLGGGISSNKTHAMVFFALTPQVLDVPHSEQE